MNMKGQKDITIKNLMLTKEIEMETKYWPQEMIKNRDLKINFNIKNKAGYKTRSVRSISKTPSIALFITGLTQLFIII